MPLPSSYLPQPVLWAIPAIMLVINLGAPVGLAQDGSSFGGGFPENRTFIRMADRAPIFFPPSPPPLGRALPRGAQTAGRLPAPAELAAHVNELYYPQLATRLASGALPTRLRTQLDQYLARKRALQAELRSELDRVREVDATARESALTALSRRQAAPLAALENEAEQLRRDLIIGDKAWGALRTWHLSDKESRGFSPLEIAQVMRASVYYSAGLLPAQRRLLREIALELQYAGESAETAAANQPYTFFPPEPARVLLPDDLPATVSSQLAQYQTRKSALKKELYDTVFAHDGQTFGFLRGNSLKALAERQATALAELETLAEEIRRGLADMPEVAPVAERTPLTPVLHQRVATLLREVTVAQKEAAEKIDAILAEARELPMQATYRFEPEGLKFLVIPSRAGRSGAPSAEAQARINEVRAKITAISESYGQLLAGFINERDAIRAEVANTLGLTKADRIDQALSTAMRVATARETADVYRDYRVALFQPGLSPAQRRLIFDQVVERLELPLPRGELQPVMRAPTW